MASDSDPSGPWGDFARATVEDWLRLLAAAQPRALRRTARGRDQRTATLAVLRGGMLDLLATGERLRINRGVEAALAALASSGDEDCPHRSSPA